MDSAVFLNKKVDSLQRSPTLKITSLAKKLKKEGKDVINFAAGEPDFDTPSFVKQAAQRALAQGLTKYTPSAGSSELREAIAQKLRDENHLDYHWENILVTSGAKYSVFLAIYSLVNPQDEVILSSPYWVSYPEMIKLTGGKIVILPTTKEENFKINPLRLQKAITQRTKLLILNYPANPTGITYTAKELESIWDVIRGRHIFVLSDEIYEKIIFDERTHISFGSLEGASEQVVTVNGFSKSFSMTGWRLGYLGGPLNVIGYAQKIIDHTTSCANSIAQVAGLAALRDGRDWCKKIKNEFQERRDCIYEGLSSCKNMSVVRPMGTFYIFCDIHKTGLSAAEFSTRLLKEQLVAVIPSEGFGLENFLRISFATDKEHIIQGVQRIKNFVSSL